MIGPTIAEAIFWYYSSTLFLLMPPPVGGLFLIVWTGAFFWRLIYRPSARRASRDAVGLRPLGPSVPWLGAAILMVVIMYVAFVVASDHVFPHDSPSLDYLARYSLRPWGGWATIAFLIVVGAPMMEEFVFRGVVQHALERRFGPAIGISGAALLFSMIHLRPAQLADFFVFGAASGLLVYRTRSLWAGIAMHSMTNGCILLMGQISGLSLVGHNRLALPFWACAAAFVVAALIFAALLSRIQSAPITPAPALDGNADTRPDTPPVALS